ERAPGTAPPRRPVGRGSRVSGARGPARSDSSLSYLVPEPVGRRAQRQLRIDALLSGPVDKREQLVADGTEGFLIRLLVARGRPAASRRGPALHLARVE